MADPILLVLLVAVGAMAGWWTAAGTHVTLRDLLDWPRARALVASYWRHRYGQVLFMMLLWLGTGWGVMVSSVGLKQTLRNAMFAPSEADIEGCFMLQKTYLQDIELRHIRQGKIAGSTLPSPRAPCPQGGEYLLDDDGHIYCTRHGRNPQLPSVFDMNTPRYRPASRY